MTSQPVIMFMFAGRRENLEVNLPLIRRILEENPNVTFDAWNLARTYADRAWLPKIKGERITVRNDLNWDDRFDGTGFGYMPVYGWYSQLEYRDHLFVKIDDDVVFLETSRFSVFMKAVDEHRDHIVSANVVNNGACTPLIPGMWARFVALNIPLLDVHMHNRYAAVAHDLFLTNPDALLGQPIELTPTLDWCSINLIGYDWKMACALTERIGGPQPDHIGDRFMREWGHRIGDEGVVNQIPRMVVKGFTAAHLGFGPQHISDHQAKAWRAGYAKLATRLPPAEPVGELPELSEPTHYYPLAVGDSNTDKHRDWRAAYRAGNWTRKKIIRSIANGDHRVTHKLYAQSPHQLDLMFRAMMACHTKRAARSFAQQWAGCKTTAAEQQLLAGNFPHLL